MTKHAVHRLFEERLSRATRPFQARGKLVVRCPRCRIHQSYCICNLVPELHSAAGFLLLFYDDEVLKPSNSGKLIADLIPDTYAFIWQRTEVNPQVLTLLQQEQWYPVLVFPAEYALAEREVFEDELKVPEHKRPLFILFDGTWREAKKMFRKSPYLDQFPVLSITPEALSKFQIRKSSRGHQLATAEVAASVLSVFGEHGNGAVMNAWFDLFNYRYQQGKTAVNLGNEHAERDFLAAVERLKV
ncbi:tRNA-uridine aminocarboxypropyltransferase [Reinekea marinisedimentorum]|uniref:tRNA-uridine aminocarboxypropyltransferase n=1 Tax=Reinekea marinisedimentorum TaxID=230495 RepID=A0A4R3I828_9GAMM|nr:tRNA-uridine aminocarboxypropyltransferase [Reinekea marinisedimentorum]TCS42403.1 hypothetical protein BCF53_10364 [Reinekea marinisedimentorum]